uniref:Leucine-rich repeat protein n=1 Tax=Paramoeba aestuarina TaxID=180227 RepID=A0A7S4KGS0_9EUKA|mmetsp:Transcript_18818/g.29515  ORF Transcript_18818/g.29515 Transcript_18818/m.29515 type:complete len:261 (+) Transcript_18818:25-807(+)
MLLASTILLIGYTHAFHSNDVNEAFYAQENNHQYMSLVQLIGFQDTPPVDRSTRLLHSKLIFRPNDGPNECAWTYVVCDGQGIVRSITWSDWTVALPSGLNLHWLPQTLERVRIENIYFTSSQPFSIRNLPKAALEVTLDSCNIPGTPDLTALPAHLESLSLRQNCLTGTVLFTELPQAIQTIDLRGNFIEVVVVDNSALPMAFRKAHVSSRNGRVKVHGVEVSGDPIDARISLYSVNRQGLEVDQNGNPFVHAWRSENY